MARTVMGASLVRLRGLGRKKGLKVRKVRLKKPRVPRMRKLGIRRRRRKLY